MKSCVVQLNSLFNEKTEKKMKRKHLKEFLAIRGMGQVISVTVAMLGQVEEGSEDVLIPYYENIPAS